MIRIATCGLLLAVSAQSTFADTVTWPDWVMDPQSVASLAASECVPSSGSLSIDRQQVSANARVALAQQIGIKIEAMDKTYLSRVDEGKAPKLNSSFESTSKQTVDTMLNGARLKRLEMVKNSDGTFVCGLIVLEQESEKKMVQGIIQAKSAPIDTDTEEILLAKFRERSSAKALK
jgi:hypothetical protein